MGYSKRISLGAPRSTKGSSVTQVDGSMTPLLDSKSTLSGLCLGCRPIATVSSVRRKSLLYHDPVAKCTCLISRIGLEGHERLRNYATKDLAGLIRRVDLHQGVVSLLYPLYVGDGSADPRQRSVSRSLLDLPMLLMKKVQKTCGKMLSTSSTGTETRGWGQKLM